MAIRERWQGHPALPRDLEGRLPLVVERLCRAGAQLVYLFGSAADRAARGGEAERPEPGDLDLAVWGLEADPWPVLTDLADILGTDRVDLVVLERADPELRYRAVSSGRLLYSAGHDLENRIELGVLREYQDLAPFRRTQFEYLRARYSRHGS